MSLLILPTELLQEILQYVGPAFFNEDVRRLAVSAKWYPAARRVYLQEVYICHHRLRQLMNDPSRGEHLTELKQHTRHLVLNVGCDGQIDPEPDIVLEADDGIGKGKKVATMFKKLKVWPWSQDPTAPLPSRDISQDERVLTYFHKRKLIQDEQWTRRAQLNEDFIALARALRGSKKLESLSFDSKYIGSAFPSASLPLDSTAIISHLESRDYPLTSLDLKLDYRAGGDEGTEHICPLISRRLQTLHSLRLQLSQICPAALEMDKATFEHIPLRVLIVQLASISEDWRQGDVMPAYGCSGFVAGGHLAVKMNTQVEKLVPHMKYAEVACVISARTPVGHHGSPIWLYDALANEHSEIISVWYRGLSQPAKEALRKNRISLPGQMT